MKFTIIPIVIVAFGTVTKGLFKGQEDLEIGGRVETCCHSNSSEKTSADADVKNSQRVNSSFE